MKIFFNICNNQRPATINYTTKLPLNINFQTHFKVITNRTASQIFQQITYAEPQNENKTVYSQAKKSKYGITLHFDYCAKDFSISLMYFRKYTTKC